jgi:hypothetical protein
MNHPSSESLSRTDSRLRSTLTEVGVLGTLVMELAWFTPWFRYFNATGSSMGEQGVLAWFGAAAALAALTDRGLRASRVSRLLRSLTLLALLAVQTVALLVVFHPVYPGLSWADFMSAIAGSMGNILQVIPAELVVILSALLVFRQGIVAAEQDVLAPERLHFRFRLGIIILAAYGLIFRDAEGRFMLEALPAFFLAGLVALAVSRVDRAPSHAGEDEGLGRIAWLAVILAIIGITVGLGRGLAGILQSRLAAEISGAVASAFLGALRVLVILISPAIQALGTFLGWLITLAAGALGWPQGLASIQGTIQSLGRAVSPSQSGPPSWVQEHAREIAAAGTGLVVGLLALAAIRGGSRKDVGDGHGAAEEVEMIPLGTDDPDGARGSMRQVWRRMRAPLDALQRMLAAASVRRIYGRLLRVAKARGRSRAPAETPMEFLAVLRELFPHHQEEVEVITRAYAEVQYGGRSDQDAGIAEVRRAWADLSPRAGSRPRLPKSFGEG